MLVLASKAPFLPPTIRAITPPPKSTRSGPRSPPPVPFASTGRRDVRHQGSGRERMLRSEPVSARAALQLRAPCPLRFTRVVLPPHVRPAQLRKPAEVLCAHEPFGGFVDPLLT